jgi:hypothetical protein
MHGSTHSAFLTPLLGAHLAPSISVPIAVLLAAFLIWMWFRVGRQGLPKPIRALRRSSIFLSLLVLPGLVRGLSFLTPSVPGQQLQYVLTWTGVMAVVLLILLVACVDLLLVGRFERARAIGELRDLSWQVVSEAEREEMSSGSHDAASEPPPNAAEDGPAR